MVMDYFNWTILIPLCHHLQCGAVSKSITNTTLLRFHITRVPGRCCTKTTTRTHPAITQRSVRPARGDSSMHYLLKNFMMSRFNVSDFRMGDLQVKTGFYEFSYL